MRLRLLVGVQLARARFGDEGSAAIGRGGATLSERVSASPARGAIRGVQMTSSGGAPNACSLSSGSAATQAAR